MGSVSLVSLSECPPEKKTSDVFPVLLSLSAFLSFEDFRVHKEVDDDEDHPQI